MGRVPFDRSISIPGKSIVVLCHNTKASFIDLPVAGNGRAQTWIEVFLCIFRFETRDGNSNSVARDEAMDTDEK